MNGELFAIKLYVCDEAIRAGYEVGLYYFGVGHVGLPGSATLFAIMDLGSAAEEFT